MTQEKIYKATYKEYATCPEGLGVGTLQGIDLKESKYGEAYILDWDIESKSDGETYKVNEYMPTEITKKNKFGKRLRHLGADLEKIDDGEEIIINDYLGKRCMLTIEHITQDGEVYARIETSSPLRRKERPKQDEEEYEDIKY